MITTYNILLSKCCFTTSRHMVVCHAAKFGCMRHYVLFTQTNFKPFSALYNKNYWADFNRNHIIDTLQSCYLAYQIWKESAQRFPRYAVPKVIQISSYFSSSSQHSLIRFKTTFPYFEFRQICTVNYAI